MNHDKRKKVKQERPEPFVPILGERSDAGVVKPVVTHSAHWLAHPQFARAVGDLLARETRGIAHPVAELNEHAPFRSNRAPGNGAG
jgi:hypothetical protein